MYIGQAADHLHGMFRTAVLNRAGGTLFYPSGTAKSQCLETFPGFTVAEVLPASSGKGQGCCYTINTL